MACNSQRYPQYHDGMFWLWRWWARWGFMQASADRVRVEGCDSARHIACAAVSTAEHCCLSGYNVRGSSAKCVARMHHFTELEAWPERIAIMPAMAPTTAHIRWFLDDGSASRQLSAGVSCYAVRSSDCISLLKRLE